MKQLVVALAAAFAATAIACSPPSAEDLVQEIIEQRNNYEVTPQSWIEREDGTIYVDVLVVNNNLETSLDTLTVIVEQMDVDENVMTSLRVGMDVRDLTPGMGQSVGVTVPDAREGVEYVRLAVERNPGAEIWPEFREFDAVRPRT